MKNFLIAITLLTVVAFNAYPQANYCDAVLDSAVIVGGAGNPITGDLVLGGPPNFHKYYKINDRLYIGNAVAGNGASLTVYPGVVIFGDKASKSSIVITRGAQGFFLGTADEPIVITSCYPPGQRASGDYGGLVILGNALNNRGTELIEGGFDAVLGNHGGPVANDNSGIYQYVRVEFPGVVFTSNDEINGITLGSVGSGTTFDHCQVSYSFDDGFEWFGGDVNGKYLISQYTLDDDFDTDHGYSGFVQFGAAIRNKNIADISLSEAFESDNLRLSGVVKYAEPRTKVTFSNMTAIGPKLTATDIAINPLFFHGVHQRRATLQNIYNSAFSGWDEGMVRLDGPEVNGALIIGGAAIDSFKISHVTFAGTPRGSSTSLTPTQWNTWYDQVVYDNDDLAQPLDLGLVDMFNTISPNLIRKETSPLKSTGIDPSTINSFFTPNTFRGAFAPAGSVDGGQGRWDLPWANYDPQSTPYGFDYTIANTFVLVGSEGTRTAVFGRAAGATNGLDGSLGEFDLTSAASGLSPDLRWTVTGATFGSRLDLRSDNNASVTNPIVYTLNVYYGSGAASGETQILSWNPDNLTGGFYRLKDSPSGATINVDMRTQSSITLTNTTITTFLVEVDYDFTASLTTDASWDMLSAQGIHPSGQSINNWWGSRFPNSLVYEFNTPCDPGADGYDDITDMRVGRGVWVKNNGVTTYNTSDEWPAGLWHAVNEPLDMCAGWQMIGILEYPVNISQLVTVPAGLRTGVIYKFTNGYVEVLPTEALEPGNGYWIKMTGSGQLLLPGPFSASLPKAVDTFDKDNLAKITLTDNSGKNYTLYAADGKLVDLDYYELPPLPPAGVFDVRFGSQRLVEDLSSGSNSIEFTGVEYPVTITVDGISLKLQDVSGELIDTELRSGEKLVIDNSSINKLMILSGDIAPASYALEQNYPNPFNPTTTIKFSLPEAADVTLTIYNALGQKVAELVNTQLQAGSYSYQWNASSVASGMYMYELRSDNFVSTKKMILLK